MAVTSRVASGTALEEDGSSQMDFPQARFQAPEVVLNYAEGPPNGPPFVVLHGGAGRWQHGQGFLELLAPTWHVFAPDFRGHGGSGRVPGAYLLRDYAADTAAFVSGVVKQPAVVFGHSLGGEVGVMLAAQHPELVRALIDGDAPLSTAQHPTGEPDHRAQNVLWQSLAGRPKIEIEKALRQMPVQAPGAARARPAAEVMGDDSPWFSTQSATLHQLDPEVLAAVLAGPEVMLAGYEPHALLPRIRCPVLLLQADPLGPLQSGLLSDEGVALGLELLPNPTHVRLEGIGHPLNDAASVVAAITPFLESLAGPKSPSA